MPVTFKYDETSGVVHTTASGIISFEDLMDHIRAKAHGKLSGAAELIDARDITLDLSLAQMRQLAQETEIQLGSQKPNRTAVVTNSAFIYGLARAYASVAGQGKSQFEVFSDIQDAQGWILKNSRAGGKSCSPSFTAREDLADVGSTGTRQGKLRQSERQ